MYSELNNIKIFRAYYLGIMTNNIRQLVNHAFDIIEGFLICNSHFSKVL